MNRCSKRLFVYETPNAFIWRISQAELNRRRVLLWGLLLMALWVIILGTKGRQKSTHWTDFYLKIWDFLSRFLKSKLFLQSLCKVCVKNLERH